MLGSLAALTQGAERVDVITVKGIIDPLVVQYVGQGIKMAHQDGAQCLVILDEVDLVTVTILTGHKSLNTTAIYTQYEPIPLTTTLRFPV